MNNHFNWAECVRHGVVQDFATGILFNSGGVSIQGVYGGNYFRYVRVHVHVHVLVHVHVHVHVHVVTYSATCTYTYVVHVSLVQIRHHFAKDSFCTHTFTGFCWSLLSSCIVEEPVRN